MSAVAIFALAAVQQCSGPVNGCSVVSENGQNTVPAHGGSNTVIFTCSDDGSTATVTVRNGTSHLFRVHNLGIHTTGAAGSQTRTYKVNWKVYPKGGYVKDFPG